MVWNWELSSRNWKTVYLAWKSLHSQRKKLQHQFEQGIYSIFQNTIKNFAPHASYIALMKFPTVNYEFKVFCFVFGFMQWWLFWGLYTGINTLFYENNALLFQIINLKILARNCSQSSLLISGHSWRNMSLPVYITSSSYYHFNNARLFALQLKYWQQKHLQLPYVICYVMDWIMFLDNLYVKVLTPNGAVFEDKCL